MGCGASSGAQLSKAPAAEVSAEGAPTAPQLAHVDVEAAPAAASAQQQATAGAPLSGAEEVTVPAAAELLTEPATADVLPDLEPPDEASLRRLFDLCDRDHDGQISKREMIIALKRHPAARRLWGLPATSSEEGGSLSTRLSAVVHAFESDCTLGELEPLFQEVAAFPFSSSAEAAAGNDSSGDGGEGGEGAELQPVLQEGPKSATGWESFAAYFSHEATWPRAHACIILLPTEATTPVSSTSLRFIPTSEWAEVPKGAVCPVGLEYKMDVDTGKNYARLVTNTVDPQVC